MCSILAGLAAVSTMFSAYGQQQQADAQAAAMEQQARVAEQNAEQEKFRQSQIADKYAREEIKLRSQRKAAESHIRANAGSAGISANAGSAADLISAGHDVYNEDRMTLLSNQRNDIYNSRVAQTNYLNDAASYRAAADNARSQAKMSMIGTILGGAASIYGMTAGGGGTSSSSPSSATKGMSVSSQMGGNTRATWTSGSGYSFSPIKSYDSMFRPRASYF